MPVGPVAGLVCPVNGGLVVRGLTAVVKALGCAATDSGEEGFGAKRDGG